MDGVPTWRRVLVRCVCRRTAWANAYARRQLRLAEDELLAAAALTDRVAAAADAAERSPVRRLTERHRVARAELYAVLSRAERRVSRSGAGVLVAEGVVDDNDTARAVTFVIDEVRPGLARVASELAAAF